MAQELTYSEWLSMLEEKITAYRDQYVAAAAPGVDVGRYEKLLIRAVAKNVTLTKCRISSLAEALLESVSLGLPIGTQLGYAYIVPYKGVAQFQFGYQGLLRLAYNDGRATGAAAEVVRDGDEFKYQLGTKPFIRHVPKLVSSRDREIVGAYGIIYIASGPPFCAVTSLADLEDHAQQYIQKKGGEIPRDALYKTNPIIWYRKTMLRRALKFAPMSEMVREILNREDAYEADFNDEQPEFENGAEQETATLREAASLSSALDD